MSEQLTPEQMMEIISFKISQETKQRIVDLLEPQFNQIMDGHHHFDKSLSDAILRVIREA